MPEDERLLLIMAAHSWNELTTVVKVLHWTTHTDTGNTDAELAGRDSMFFTLVKVVIGKIFESWNMLTACYFRTRLGQTYDALIPQEAMAALKELKKYFGKKSVLADVRDKNSFHYDRALVSGAYVSIENKEALDIYFGHNGLNDYFRFADVFSNGAMLHAINPLDFQRAMTRLEDESTRIHRLLNTVLKALVELLVERFTLGTLSEDVIEFRALSPEDMRITYFVETPSFFASN